MTIVGIITLTKQGPTNSPAPPLGAGAPEVTHQMIEAGVSALQRRGVGLDGEATSFLEDAVCEVFLAMAAEGFLQHQNTEENESPSTC